MNVRVCHPHLENVLDPVAPVERVRTGFIFTEGPIWHPRDHHLIFSDIPASRLYKLDAAGSLTIVREPTNRANGNAYDREGRIITCEHGTRRVVRLEQGGALTVLATHYRGKELNSPNDVIVGSNGDIYFTDPLYGRFAEHGVAGEPELDFRGVYRLNPQTGELTLLADDFDQPNGLCFSLDEKRLFVSDTPRKHIRVFDMQADGTVTGGQVWAETAGEGTTLPDGLKIDSAGHVFSCGPGGIHIFAPDSTLLGVILVPEHTANFTWGDADLNTLYITASTSLYAIRVRVPGVPWNIRQL